MLIGNDELILHIRKNYKNCMISNDQLGKKIWKWLRDHGAEKVAENQVCEWGDSSNITSETTLPKTAAQFQINHDLLPDLYKKLEEIANG